MAKRKNILEFPPTNSMERAGGGGGRVRKETSRTGIGRKRRREGEKDSSRRELLNGANYY